MRFTNIASRFRHQIKNTPFKHVLTQKNNNQWINYTNNDLNNKTLYCIEQLKQHNIYAKDHIVYKGKNSVDWIAWNMATYSLGATWIPLYANQNSNYVNYVLSDSLPKLYITDHLEENIDHGFIDAHYEMKVISNHVPNFDVNEQHHVFDVLPEKMSNLIYTSGTSGNPKGVMLTHQNLLSNLSMIESRFSSLSAQNSSLISVNILPWAHIYSLNTELYYMLLNNHKIILCDHPDQLLNDIRKIQPHLLYFVPRILDGIKKKIEFLDKPLLSKLIPILLRKIFGKNLITIFCGGAYLSPITKKFYQDHGIQICEGYGATETSPMICVHNLETNKHIDSIGQILDNVLVEIIDDEICVHGPHVMQGYYYNKEATANAFVFKEDKKYYKTGDSGYVKDNFLYYVGRKSANYKLSNGKFVNVEEIENKIKNHCTSPLLIYGENRDYNILIMKIDYGIHKIDFLKKINQEIPKYNHIKNILNVEEDVFNRHMTPKMSLKRKEIYKFLEDKINLLYDKNEYS